jgi:hypothetical protein
MTKTASWDPTGEVARCLWDAVQEYGSGDCLSDDAWLSGFMADTLDGEPRETDLVRAAAGFGVARLLSEHIRTNMDPATAVRLTASALAARRAYPADACLWVTAGFARALGYEVAIGDIDPPPPIVDPVPPLKQDDKRHNGPRQDDKQDRTTWTTPPPSEPPRTPVAVPPKPRHAKAAMRAAVVGAVAVYLAVAAVAPLPPFSRHSPGPKPPPVTTTVPPVVTTTVPPVATTIAPLPAGVLLGTLMPDQVGTDGINVNDCGPISPPGFEGIYKSLDCQDLPGTDGWALQGFQFDNTAAYRASFAAVNTDLDFDAATAGASCPPGGNLVQGQHTWWTENVWPVATGQVLECMFAVNGDATYLWTLPSEQAFFVLFGDKTTTFAQLQTWWTDHGNPGK